MLPSAQVECQIHPSGSLRLNFHRGRINLLSVNNWMNASLDYRYYFNKKREYRLSGFYLSSGFAVHHNYNYPNYSLNNEFINYGKTHLGMVAKLGIQSQFAKN